MIRSRFLDVFTAKVSMVLIGATSLIWFLIRVIPKPSRASYPCMQAAAPLASAFVMYLLALTGFAVFAKKTLQAFQQKKLMVGFAFGLVAMGFFTFFNIKTSKNASAIDFGIASVEHLKPNEPIGEGKGIFPGRVVWSHDPAATNPSLDPSSYGNSYWKDKNTDQAVVNQMLSAGLKELTGAGNEKSMWDSIFYFHNNQNGKGRIGYKAGEKIFIKLNATSTWSSNIDLSDFSREKNSWYGLSETLPQLVTAVLKQLVNVVGVAQENIYVGDPMKHIYQDNYERWKTEFPNVHYLDNDRSFSGREVAAKSTQHKIVYSDKGTVLTEKEDFIYSIFNEATYVINLPTLKGHKYAGITAFAKNHFGSQTRKSASHLHNGLVLTAETGGKYRTSYGIYRVQVDIMGHKLLSGKNLVYIMDAFYATYHELEQPVKWKMAPFNGHWMSSLFLSFDPVAIESVGFDFLYAEFDGSDGNNAHIRMGGVDDYLEQAADKSKWPAGIQYAPNGDGKAISGLGVHEHWDSPETKRYSQNLGLQTGIDLRYVSKSTSVVLEESPGLVKVYPNPFTDRVVIEGSLSQKDKMGIFVYDNAGKLIFNDSFTGTYVWNALANQGSSIPAGQYIIRVTQNEKKIYTGKFISKP
jgi:hypothetical protein